MTLSSNMFDAAATVVFVGALLSKYMSSVLIRRLRDHHDALWTELGQPRVWQLLINGMGNWRLTAFVWATDPTDTGDDEIVLCVWTIRVLAAVVLTTIIVIMASVFGWHPG